MDEELGNQKEVDEREENINSGETEEDEEEKEIYKIFRVYVSYGGGNLVFIQPHFNRHKQPRMPPLLTVYDLIKETKVLLPSTLGSVDINQLILHTTENGFVSETSLERNTKLSSIPLTTGRTEENPLVIMIKKGKYRSTFEYLPICVFYSTVHVISMSLILPFL